MTFYPYRSSLGKFLFNLGKYSRAFSSWICVWANFCQGDKTQGLITFQAGKNTVVAQGSGVSIHDHVILLLWVCEEMKR